MTSFCHKHSRTGLHIVRFNTGLIKLPKIPFAIHEAPSWKIIPTSSIISTLISGEWRTDAPLIGSQACFPSEKFCISTLLANIGQTFAFWGKNIVSMSSFSWQSEARAVFGSSVYHIQLKSVTWGQPVCKKTSTEKNASQKSFFLSSVVFPQNWLWWERKEWMMRWSIQRNFKCGVTQWGRIVFSVQTCKLLITFRFLITGNIKSVRHFKVVMTTFRCRCSNSSAYKVVLK